MYSSIAVLLRLFARSYHHVNVKVCFLHPVMQDRQNDTAQGDPLCNRQPAESAVRIPGHVDA